MNITTRSAVAEARCTSSSNEIHIHIPHRRIRTPHTQKHQKNSFPIIGKPPTFFSNDWKLFHPIFQSLENRKTSKKSSSSHPSFQQHSTQNKRILSKRPPVLSFHISGRDGQSYFLLHTAWSTVLRDREPSATRRSQARCLSGEIMNRHRVGERHITLKISALYSLFIKRQSPYFS